MCLGIYLWRLLCFMSLTENLLKLAACDLKWKVIDEQSMYLATNLVQHRCSTYVDVYNCDGIQMKKFDYRHRWINSGFLCLAPPTSHQNCIRVKRKVDDLTPLLRRLFDCLPLQQDTIKRAHFSLSFSVYVCSSAILWDHYSCVLCTDWLPSARDDWGRRQEFSYICSYCCY